MKISRREFWSRLFAGFAGFGGFAGLSRNPIAPWKIPYGRTRCGGTITYFGWQVVSMSPRDIEFIETRKFQADEIARIFAVPLPKPSGVSEG
ncbi:MAG TPA: hypothetical protein VNO24_00525 [Blastocatellia bacterium]|nr:hypothetical protein [Blastocatellia bacterium]